MCFVSIPVYDWGASDHRFVTVVDWIPRGTRLQVNICSYKCVKHISRELFHNYFTSAGKAKSQIIKQSMFIWVWHNSSALLGKGKNPQWTLGLLWNCRTTQSPPRWGGMRRCCDLCVTHRVHTHLLGWRFIHNDNVRNGKGSAQCAVRCVTSLSMLQMLLFKSFPSTSGPKVD